ncbi:TPA: hypothetical protein QCR24_004282 [Bacillus cereus]|nr:hypothetical protein [Bacillus cereus]
MKEYILTFLQTAKLKRVPTEKLETFLYKECKYIYEEQGGYKGFAHAMLMLVEEGFIKPIKSWGENSLFPPLYNGYQAILLEVTNENHVKNLLTKFHPTLSLAYYATHYTQYQIDKPLIQAISDFLYQKKTKNRRNLSERAII